MKGWHFIAGVAAILITFGIAWGTLNARVEQHDREIQDIKQERYVPKEDFWQAIGDLKREIEELRGEVREAEKLRAR